MSQVILKKSSVAGKVPLVTDLAYGELAINYADGIAYFKKSSNVIASFNSDVSGFATITGTETLTNKTLASPSITGNISGDIAATGNLKSLNSIGDEGGEILLAKAQTNTTLEGTGVTIDVYQNKLRIFEQGGTSRGVYIDLTSAAASVGSNLLATAAGVTSVAGKSGVVTLVKADVGLGNVDNTSDSAKSVLNATNLTGGTITSTGGVISANSSTDALRITQEGTGNALVVEDETNPDQTPTVITNDGRVLIGTSSPISTAQTSIHISKPLSTNFSTSIFANNFIQPAANAASLNNAYLFNGQPQVQSDKAYAIGTIINSRSVLSLLNSTSGATVANYYAYQNSGADLSAGLNYGFHSNFGGAPYLANTTGQTISSIVSSVSASNNLITVTTATPHGLTATGNIFIIRLVANATNLVNGVPCTISSAGTTDFTLIGASSNTVGTVFIATGAGTGTGQVNLNISGSKVTGTIIDANTVQYTQATLGIGGSTITFAPIVPASTSFLRIPTVWHLYCIGDAPSHHNGNFAIGTTSLTSKLTVGGVIESNSGGFKFPDGTTQISANLDASKITSGVLDAARLPSYVDDVLEYSALASFPASGETGKIYVDLTTNKTYRWSGSTYVYITSGAVDSVAGKTGVVTLVKSDVGLGNVDNTADAAKNVLSATKLTTARTIGDVSFDGTANINLPGVNTAGNQNTTGSAATLTTARTLTIGSTGKTFNGSADVSWSLTEIGAVSSSLGIFTAPIKLGTGGHTGDSVLNSLPLTGGSGWAYGFNNISTISGDTTQEAVAYHSWLSTQAVSFNLTSLAHFKAYQGTIGAGSTVTNQYGFSVASNLTGATYNYGFHSNIASGNNLWNFYAAGTAPNYFAGNVGIGTSTPQYKLDVNDISVTGGGLRVTGGGSGGDLARFERTQGATGTYISIHASGNDPQLRFVRAASVNKFSIGVDDGDLFKISYGETGVNDRVTIDTTGKVGIGTTSPIEILDIRGNLAIGGADAGPNYIAFRGTTGDQPGTFTHTYIGEYLYGGTENSELLIYKGNDIEGASGPDRIRSIASNHVFQTYTSALSGTFSQIATSTVPITRLIIKQDGKVGVGTDAPAQLLSVAGTLGISESGQNGNRLQLSSSAAGAIINQNDNSPLSLQTQGTTAIRIAANQNVAVGFTTDQGYKLAVNGSFAATTKSFVIEHPTKLGKKLRYGSLEGPENGVYVRGKLTGNNIIELPEYWTKLVDPDSITVQLTPIGRQQKLYVKDIKDNKVYVGGMSINCYYTIYAERCDVEKLEVECD